MIAKGLDDTWSMDLIFMLKKKEIEQNAGNKYILTVIDLFSRYAWAVPLKDKTAGVVWAAFERILSSSGRTPKNLWADEGSEFYNEVWKDKLALEDITLYSTGSDRKAPVIERFNRTLKTWMYETFTVEKNEEWVTLLPDLMKRYNSEHVNSTIKLTPEQASKQDNVAKVEAKMPQLGKVMVPLYKLNTWVRVLKMKGRFEKGYTPKWSEEIFKIVRIDLNQPLLYHVQDVQGDDIQGGFYENEVQQSGVEPPVVELNLTNTVKVDGDREVAESKVKKGMERFSKYELHVAGKWVPLTKFLKLSQGQSISSKRKSYNIEKVAKYVHDVMPHVWEML